LGTSGKPGEGDAPHGQGEDAGDLERTQRLTDLLGPSSGDPGEPPADEPADDTPADDAAGDAVDDAPSDSLDPGADDGPDAVPATERIEFPIDLSTPPPEIVDERSGDRPGPTDRIRYRPGDADDGHPGPTDRIQYSPDAHHGEDDEDDDEGGGPVRPPGWAPAPEGFAPGTIGEPGAGRPTPAPVNWGPSPGQPLSGPPVVVPGTPVAGPAAGGGQVIGGPSYQTTVQHQTIEQQNIGQQIVHGGGGPGGQGGQGAEDAAGARREEVEDVVSEVAAPVQSRPSRPEDLRRAAQKEAQPQGPGRLSDRIGAPTRKGRERERVVGDTPALRGLPGGPGLRGGVQGRRGDTPADRHTPGMPSPSVWQRLNLVWRDTGTDWERARRDGAEWQQSADAFLPGGRKRSGPLPDIPRPLLITMAAVAAVLLVIVGVSVLSGGGEKPNDGRIGGASEADAVFAAPPGAKGDGVDQGVGAVGRYGSRLVMTGREKGGAFDRPQFFSSSDGGTTWMPGVVKGPNGGAVPPGGAPTRVVGGPSGWIALNIANVPVWSSTDGNTWTQVPDDQAGTAFRDGDSVAQLVAKSTGFMAVGTHTSGKDTTPVVWSSDDGKSWTRNDRPQLEVSDGSALKLSGLATRGDVLVAGGTVHKTVTKEVTVKKGKKKTKEKKKTSVTTDGFWTSTDDGATWQSIDIPQAGGSTGSFIGLTANKQSFYLARAGSGGHNAVVMASPDGRSWKQSGSINGGKKDNLSISMLTGADNGVAALGSIGNGHNVVYRSTDGKTFDKVGDLGPAKDRTIRGVEPSTDGVVVVGSTFGEDENAYVATASSSGNVKTVDMTKVAGAVHPDHAVSDVRFAGGRYVAVGGANGDAAAWTSADGRTWRPATAEDGAFARSGDQRLKSVVKGASGWLAVGSAGEGHPLVTTSADSAKWAAVDGDKAFSGSKIAANAAGAGPAGYVVVGSSGDDAAAWSSKDLKTWTKGEGDGLSAPKGATATMNDVAAGPFGYVAVGSIDGDSGSEPSAWISSDGVKWTHVEMDLPQGAGTAQLTRIAVNGNRLVAAGVSLSGDAFAPFTMTSVDGGKSWQPAQPPGEGTADARVSDVTPMGKGFALLASQGAQGATHVRLWTSANGTTWKARPLKGDALVGESGTQVVNAAAVSGGRLLGVGSTADARSEHVTLWRTPLK